MKEALNRKFGGATSNPTQEVKGNINTNDSKTIEIDKPVSIQTAPSSNVCKFILLIIDYS